MVTGKTRSIAEQLRRYEPSQSNSVVPTVRQDAEKKEPMRKALQVFLATFGVVVICIALLHIALGPVSIPGAIPVNPTMDSEDRFFATPFLAFGVALIWCVRQIERKARVVYFLMITFFVGGVARIVSMLFVGPPHPFFLLMTILELMLPLLFGWMQLKVVRAHGH